jgi:hypothetical protein
VGGGSPTLPGGGGGGGGRGRGAKEDAAAKQQNEFVAVHLVKRDRRNIEEIQQDMAGAKRGRLD